MTILVSLLIWLTAIAVAITVHEFSHAFISDRLGDPTARLKNRLSLNPLDHYDRVGTTLLLVTSAMKALGAPVIPFGWAKPVEYDPYNLRNPKRDTALIALAGPASNFITAIILSILLKTFLFEIPILASLLYAIITLNVSLALFNLIPVHPLDGSKILLGLLSDSFGHEYQLVMNRYGTFILFMLIIPWNGTSAVSALISPIYSFFMSLLLP
jgi:Zn-dependent protease